MSQHVKTSTEQRNWIVPMRSRSPEEEHRAATPLELFFDLVFVVAVAIYMMSLWVLHWRPHTLPLSQTLLFPIGALLILLTPLTGQAALWTGLLLVGVLVIKFTHRYRRAA